MFQDKNLNIEQLKNEYFSKLFEKIIHILRNQDFGIINFFYKIVFDQTYYQLTRIAKYPEIDLNYGIAKMLLYPNNQINLINTSKAIQLIPMFLIFIMGQKLDINCCIKLDFENEWEIFLTAVAKKINYEEAEANEYLRNFHIKLEMESKQSQAIDLEKTMNQITSYTKGENLLKLINQMFYQDSSIFAVNQCQNEDEFFIFQSQKKFEIITNSYQFIQMKFKKEIENTVEDSKMKVNLSFLQQDYNYNYITERFDNREAGIIIFSLIQLDNKQFQNFFYLKSPAQQEQLLNQIMIIAGNTDKHFFNLILVGKCLSKLRHWEYAFDIFTKLYKQITNHLNREKFRAYIYFKICKIQLMQGQIQGLLKKLIYLSDLMQQYQEKNLEFYQPANRNLYNSCLFLQLLISAYTKQIDKLKHITIKISTLHIQSNYKNSLKRPFNLLQYEFFRLVQEQGVIFQEKDGQKQLEHMLQVIQRLCEQRQIIEQKKSNLLQNIKQIIFDSPNRKNNQLIEIKSYYKAIEELLIINVLVRHREIYILQYLNPNFYPLLRIFLAEKNFFNQQLKSQIYFFIHDFEQAHEIALQTNNHKMIGQILEYYGKYQEAIEHYKKDISPSCFFNCAILQKILQDECQQKRSSLDKSGFEKIQQTKQLSIDSFINLAQSQNQYKMIAQMFQNVLLGRQYQQQVSEKLSEDIEDVNTIKVNQGMTSSVKLTNSNQQYQNNNCLIESQNQLTMIRSYDSRISRQQQIVQSEIYESGESDTSCSREQLSNEENILLKMQYLFPFPIRKDIEFFYKNLKNDIISESDIYLEKTLNEFVRKTQFLTYESNELFNNTDLKELIGQGGNSHVYKFNFQGKQYAAKVIQFEYKGSGETINNDEKSEIERKILEICIVCDITLSKIKYCLRIEHLGFKFEKLHGQTKVYKIILITNYYDNYQQLKNWEEIDKIKYVYKLSLGLATLQFEKELLHLDMKPDNVLVDSKKKNPVLADFGLSKYSQKSQCLAGGPQQVTIKYTDPDLICNNLQSRKNDVYSFGVSLFQYFSGTIPFKEFNYQQVFGIIKQFQEYHKNIIQQIDNIHIRNLILDCTKSIENRISFVLVLKRLFFYLYQIKNPKVNQLVETLFDLMEVQQDQRQVQNLYAHLKVIKKFIRQVDSFQPIPCDNKFLQSYIIISSKDSTECFSEIIQRMKQFINWITLSKEDFVLKLLDFEINIIEINSNEKKITYNFWIEDADEISKDRLILWQSFFLQIALNLKQIYNSQIFLLQLPLSSIFEKNGIIKINCLEYSQNHSIDSKNTYYLDNITSDSQVKKQQKISILNNSKAFCILMEQTIKSITQFIDQSELEKIIAFKCEIENQNEAISLEQIIDKLQH